MNVCDILEKHLDIQPDSRMRKLISQSTCLRNFTEGTIVLNEGEFSKNVYLIVHGIVRGYYLDGNGNEVTKCFSAENEFFCTESFRTKEPSTYFIECLEDCQCAELPYSFIRQAMKQDETLGLRIGQMFEREVSNLEYRNKNILMLSAEERYLDFCRTCPHLPGRIQQRYISSYIAVRPETLSRIRKNLRWE